MFKKASVVVLFLALLSTLSEAKDNIFKEQHIGFGYYPSFRGSQNFWLNYTINKRKDKKFSYSMRGLYNFRTENIQQVTNYAVGPCLSIRLFQLFKNQIDIRQTTYLPYVKFKYEKSTYPGSLYPSTFSGLALLPGLGLQIDLSDRIGFRYGANAGVYVAKTKDPIFENRNGQLYYTVYSNRNLYWILLIDFSITIKITKNYLPHQQ
jgi:hypothetical protein